MTSVAIEMPTPERPSRSSPAAAEQHDPQVRSAAE
jgi:hypothetical protein